MLRLERASTCARTSANAFIVNYLWLPALLAVVAIVLVDPQRRPTAIRRVVALLAGSRGLRVDDADVPDLHRAALRRAADAGHAADRAVQPAELAARGGAGSSSAR